MKKLKAILSYAFISALSGAFAGTLIFIFKMAASYVIHSSVSFYECARENVEFALLLIFGVALISLAIYFILKYFPDCRGGGIPTVIENIKGNVSFNWITTILFLPLSALFTFFSGIPLGNEGPSVQLGCAAGKGVASLCKNKDEKREKYIMTATASAGFAAATGAPFSAVVFAFEEIYRSFSATLLLSSVTSIACATITNGFLSKLFHSGTRLFSFSVSFSMPLKYVWSAILVGIAAGVWVLVTELFEKYADKILKAINNVSMFPKILVVSLGTALFGLCSKMYVGSGHDLIETIFENRNFEIWMLVSVLFVRALLLISANNVGITGGKFLPTLALGAILGELSARLLIYMGLMGGEYRTLLVLMGIAAFLGAKSHIPIVALCFSVEALCGFSNIVHFIVSIGVSYLFVRIFKAADFSESVIKKNNNLEVDV